MATPTQSTTNPGSTGATPGATGATGTTVAVTGAQAPPTPLIGNVQDGWPWTGGRPDTGWVSSERTTPSSPYCFRPTNPDKGLKIYQFCTSGKSVKFKRADKDNTLTSFATSAHNHMRRCGMDSIFYVPDPTDGGEMRELFTNHSSFTYPQVQLWVAQMKAGSGPNGASFDTYDMENLEVSKDWLFDSIDADLQSSLEPRMEDDITGPELWMLIVGEVQSDSIRRYKKISRELEALKLTSFPGENVKKCAATILIKCRELDRAKQLPDDVLLTIVECFCKSTVEEFRIAFLMKRSTVELFMATIAGKSTAAIALLPNRITYQGLCQEGSTMYQSILDSGDWGPASNAGDSGNAPQAFYTKIKNEMNEVKGLLKQSISANGSGDRKCFNCDQPGHMQRDCTKPRRDKKKSGTKPTREASKHAWKRLAPKDGEPQSKTITGVDKPFLWCKTCTRWSTSHGSDGHKSKEELGHSQPAGNVAIVGSTSGELGAWMAVAHVVPDDSTVTSLSVRDLDGWCAVTSKKKTRHHKLNNTGLPPKRGPQAFMAGVHVLPIVETVSEYDSDDDTPTATTVYDGENTNMFDSDNDSLRQAHILTDNVIDDSEDVFFDTISEELDCSSDVYYASVENLPYYNLVTTPVPRKPTSYGVTSPRIQAVPCQWGVLSGVMLLSMWSVAMFMGGAYDTFGLNAVERWFQITAPSRTRSRPAPPLPIPKKPPDRFNFSDHFFYEPSKSFETFESNYWTTYWNDRVDDYEAMYWKRYWELHPTRADVPIFGRPGPSPDSLCGRLLTAEGAQARVPSFTWGHQAFRAPFAGHTPLIPSIDSSMGCRVLSQHPRAFWASLKDDLISAIWDTGATMTVTFCKNDFIDGVRPTDQPLVIGGLANGLHVEGEGQVQWSFLSDEGTFITLQTKAYYVPSAGQRLISPQYVAQERHREHPDRIEKLLDLDHACVRVNFPEQGTLTVPYDKASNLPVSYAFQADQADHCLAELNLCVTEESNQNLSYSQKELMQWHFRLGHLNFRAVQAILKSGALGHTPGAKAASRCAHPKCASCQYGKGHRRPTKSTTTKPVDCKVGALKKEDLFPGQRISMDHFKCSTKGRLYTSRGKTSDDSMYTCGCIFVDHASGHVHVEHQVGLTSNETLQAKLSFERAMMDHGTVIDTYQSDNGVFKAQDFIREIEARGQSIGFAGVGAHHHNGVAERAIGTVMSMARTMMLHAAIRWPEVSDATLWPMAVDYAVHIHNHTPKWQTGMTPLDLLTKTTLPRHQLQQLHVWGCPSYVLDPSLQDGKKIPKWQPRSRRAVFVGLSKKHSSTVPLVMNCDTLAISPQFHVVFDDWFSTVLSTEDPAHAEGATARWHDLFLDSRHQSYFDEDDPIELDEQWLSEQERAWKRHNERTERIRGRQVKFSDVDAGELERETEPVQPPQPKLRHANAPLPTILRSPPRTPPHETPMQSPLTSTPPPPTPERLSFSPSPTSGSPPPDSPSPKLRRSSRLRTRKETRFGYDGTQGGGYIATVSTFVAEVFGAVKYPEFSSPSAFAAKARADPDTLMYHEAMASTDAAAFREAMAKEINTLAGIPTWIIVPRSQVKEGAKIVPSTWTFKRKRYPDGRIRKYKARFCVRGDLQGPSDESTYAPVVQWATVRMILVLSLVFDLEMRQVDFTNAFAQADIKTDVYLDLPKGFRNNDDPDGDYVLKLKKTLYGMKESPRNFFELLSSVLGKQGLKATILDPCLFIGDGVLCICWVDDLIWVSKDGTKLDRMIKSIHENDLPLTTEEGDISAFLGIDIVKNTDGRIQLLQTGLTEKILEATGMTDSNPNKTPAVEALGPDPDGEPLREDWNYRSVIGMLLYLASNSRPDIAFAVHQCARFSHDPKVSHGMAVKRICHYLKGTKDKGMIFQPKHDLTVDCFVDADYAGLWGVEDIQDPQCVKSRTGYVLMLAGCPLSWVSKLQTEVALSTMHAEYVALSTSCRDVIPMRQLVKLAAEGLGFDVNIECRTHSTIFEDNNGALTLANVPRMTPTSKSIAVKYHWFRDQVQNGELKVVKVDTKENSADLFTKACERETFERLRMMLCGW